MTQTLKELQLSRELTATLNRHSAENESGTPDFILAEYMLDCLKAFNKAAATRAAWKGGHNA